MARDYWVWLYSHIEHWCGNSLAVELADAVSAAPAEQIVAFSQSFDGGPSTGIGELMAAGSLRPLVAPPDLWRDRPTVDSIPMALRLLLYVPEVILESDFLAILFSFDAPADVTPERRTELRQTLRALSVLRPLALSGAVHVSHVLGKAAHPSHFGRAREAISDPDMANLAREIGGIPPEADVDPADLAHILRSHFGVLYFACNLAKQRLATPLALSEADIRVLSATLSRQIQDGRHTTVSHLAGLSVPEFQHNTDLLVRLRNDDAAFGEWREKLGRALTAIDSMPDSADMSEAADIVRMELESATVQVNQSVSRSPALTAIKGGLRRIGIDAIGAGTAGLITGNPFVALAALGASQLADTALSYVSERSQHRSDRLILDVIASFTPTSD